MNTRVRPLTTHLVAIGNSRGLRLPKVVIEQVGLEDEVILEVQDGALIVRPRHPRAGWEEAAAMLATRSEDALLDPETPTTWDEAEWQW